MITIVLYIVTILLVITTISSWPQTKVAEIVAKLSNSNSIGGLFAGLGKWILIEYVWFLLDGRQIPVTILAACFLYLAVYGMAGKKKLSDSASALAFAEQWSIVLVGLAVGVDQYGIRWY